VLTRVDLMKQYNRIPPDFSGIRYFLLDMDGSFFIGNTIIDGSLSFIDKLYETGRDFLFLTNNSMGNAEYYADKLKSMGLEINPNKIFTSCEATGIYLQKNHPGARLFVIGNFYLKSDLIKHGLQVVGEDPDFVIVGFDTTLTWEKLKKACLFIESGVPYITTHPDTFCPSENGRLPDCGAITAAILATNDIPPSLIIGKPNRHMAEAALFKLGTTADRVAMCGDRIPTDMVMAITAGMTSCLLLSGETDEEMLRVSDIKPQYVFSNLAAIIPALTE
jgi:HAD superfamily hydrolase (TIGR01450 family)